MDSSNLNSPRQVIARIVEEQGLHLLAVAPLAREPDFIRFKDWLAAEKHAEMNFLTRHLHCRENPEHLLPGAKSALVVCYRYGQRESWRRPTPLIAQYARIKDYHRFLRKRGTRIVDKLHDTFDAEGNHSARVLVDSAPILERALAARHSQAFIGKNTMLIDPELGSFILLGEILTTLPLEHDTLAPQPNTRDSQKGGCGSCRRCQIHCPTGALGKDYVLDANLCLSYWTIEHRGLIPERFWPWIGYFVFGCDICQSVCPYNRNAPPLNVEPELKRLNAEFEDLYAVATMSQDQYESWFGGTPLTRAKRDGLRRNALIAMYVREDPKLSCAIEVHRHSENPVEVLLQTITQITKNPLNFGM